MRAYIGTYSVRGSAGIYALTGDAQGMAITPAADTVNPSWLTWRAPYLFAVNETAHSAVVSYEAESFGTLRRVAERPTCGASACHLLAEERWLYVSEYSSGTLSVLACEGGELPEAAWAVPPLVPGQSHAHQAQFSPDGAFITLCDLGCDRVTFFPRTADGLQQPGEAVELPKGAGPRHLVFGADENWYLLSELSCELFAFRGYGRAAVCTQRIKLPGGDAPGVSGAALRLSPDGSLLLASLRGADALILLDVDAQGAFAAPRSVSAGGHWPRDAAFSPDGRWVLCACERGDCVTRFAVRDGALVYRDQVAVPAPTGVCFVE
ncbi:MAG: lactonase family protein [Oscillospiraceae bacterium]|jgi:6-phosphogluconolactonase|nr:lactonase family protein [Oscillospiraceae bacterium]